MSALKEIQDLVEAKLKMRINNKTRRREQVYARAVVLMLADRYLDVTSTDLGRFLGKNHATILHYRKNVYHHIKREPKFFKAYTYLCNMFDKKYNSEDKDEMLAQVEAIPSTNYHIDFLKSLLDVMKQELISKDKEIQRLQNKLGSFEDHELRYRDLPEEKKDIFKTRVDAILKMI